MCGHCARSFSSIILPNSSENSAEQGVIIISILHTWYHKFNGMFLCALWVLGRELNSGSSM